LVTFAGRLIPAKGADVALEAFARVARSWPDARLVLVGDGPQLAELRRRVTDLGLGGQVELTGHLPVDELHQLLSTSWVHLMPSRWAEPFGLAAAAALMRGVSVVASAGGGLADLLADGETGVLVAPGDVEGTARGLDGLLRDPRRRAAIGAAGRRLALDRLTGPRFLDRMVKTWESIL
jgi:glycosyltransferase involved in cell wall biosynthesis